jgi:hypothetical protein
VKYSGSPFAIFSNYSEHRYLTVSLVHHHIWYLFPTEASRNAQVRQKEGYDIKVRGATIQKGDRVLVKEVSFDGKHKLADTKMEISCAVPSEFSVSVDSLSSGLSIYSTSDSSVASSVESSEVDGFTATGIDF